MIKTQDFTIFAPASAWVTMIVEVQSKNIHFDTF